MIEMKRIERLASRIADDFSPERIILFGSYAEGTPTEDSDVDLFIEMRFRGKSVYKALEIREKVRPRFAVDFIVRTPEEVKKRVAMNDWFLRDIVEKGKTLYEAPDGRMGQQS